MQELLKNQNAQIEIKGSKFLCFLEPCADIRAIRERQAQLRAEHPKSVHVVYAARALNEFEQIAEDFSDDGEPKGSSAAPMLNVLRGAELINAQALVVRYFGGTLLGIGGLVRAYSAALNEAIAHAKTAGAIGEFVKKERYFIDCEYENYRQLEYLCAEYEKQAFFSDCVRVELALSSEQAAALRAECAQKLPHLKFVKFAR